MQQEYVILIVSLAVVLVVIWTYQRERSRLTHLHSERCRALQSCYKLHRQQLDNRQAHLRQYDWRQNNLQDALVVQAKVVC